jgi:uncharacterized protein with PQ loop repeat
MPIYSYVQMVLLTPNWIKMILMDQILKENHKKCMDKISLFSFWVGFLGFE